MTLILSDARTRYEQERPDYQDFARHVQTLVSEVLRNHRIPFRSESRAKETKSLLLKLANLDGKVGYDQIRDKAGVRVIVPSNRYVAPSADAITADVAGAHIVNRNEPKFDVPMFTITQDWAGTRRPCEVQVVTESTIWWANLSHRYVYKAGRASGQETHRAVERLRALAELVDIEVDRIDAVFQTESSTSDRFAIEVTNEWVCFRGVPDTGRWETTSRFFASIDDESTTEERLSLDGFREFIEKSHARLAGCLAVLDEHQFMLSSQPELIWILFQLDKQPMMLQSIWPEWLGGELFDEIRLWWEASA